MKYAEEFETKMNEIKEAHEEKVAEIMSNMNAAKANKQEAVDNYELAVQMGWVEEAVEAKQKIEIYEEAMKMYQELLTQVSKEVLVTESEYTKQLLEIKKAYAPYVVSGYKKYLKALDAARDALLEVYKTNSEAHACADMLVNLAHSTDTSIEYHTPFTFEFSINDMIGEPIGFSTTGKRTTKEDSFVDTDMFKQVQIQIEHFEQFIDQE